MVGAFAWRRTRAVAVFAGFVAANCDLRLGAEEGFFEFEGQVLAEIGATLHAAATPSAASASTEHVAEAEEFSEDVAEILEDAGIESGAPWPAPPPSPAWP